MQDVAAQRMFRHRFVPRAVASKMRPISLVGLFTAFYWSSGLAAETQWLEASDCKFQRPPEAVAAPPVRTVWSGSCADGFLRGFGELITEWPAKPTRLVFKGEFAKGQIVKGYRQADANRYEGEFRNMMAHGKGVITNSIGRSIAGAFVENHVSGHGTYEVRWPNGAHYVGPLDLYERMQGTGVLDYPDGSTYTGQFHDDREEGTGERKFPDGELQRGQFVAGVLHGHGYIRYPNSTEYEGDLRAGEPNGNGSMRFAGGGGYTGSFLAGKYSGKGKVVYIDDGWCEGSFVDGELSGHAECLYGDGNRFDGDFVNGKKSGKGTLTHPDGTTQVGEYRMDKLNGKCRLNEPDEKFYQGDCVDSKPDGIGHLEEPATHTTYDGGWRKGLYHGEGTLTTANGVYTGGFQNGEKHGHGSQTEHQGTAEVSYEGEFAHDVWHGHGVMRLGKADGTSIKYEGEYARGELNGSGVLQVGATTMRGEFKDNELYRGTVTLSDRVFEVDTEAGSIAEVMPDGSKHRLDALPAGVAFGT